MSSSRFVRFAVAALAFPVLFGSVPACNTALYHPEDSDPQWVDYQLDDGPPRRDLFCICSTAFHRSNFPPGLVEDVVGQVSSGWDVSLAPYSYQGFREQCIIQVVPGTESYSYLLRVRVRREVNLEVHSTLEISAAEWEPAADNPERARLVLEHIKAQIRPTRDRY